jgi:hypothetical protein
VSLGGISGVKANERCTCASDTSLEGGGDVRFEIRDKVLRPIKIAHSDER